MKLALAFALLLVLGAVASTGRVSALLAAGFPIAAAIGAALRPAPKERGSINLTNPE